MLHIKFQASKPSGFEGEDFLIFFYVFLRLEPRIPWQGALLDPGTSLNNLGKGLIGNASYPILSI